ncbi:stage III sporulation protein AA [Anaeroselena agilis]|uniref:Stage III sporulation protein AA n=1 Tax=Anaeroselena agilis TaxID=3063788 RepID=A0ABU3NW78_9FIRM|nr:stage III sporulation protein AA [Selenomonadales bacterium 4137-cl]
MSYCAVLAKTLFPMLAPTVAAVLRAVSPALLDKAGEVRVRAGKPLLVVTGDGDVFLDAAGRPSQPAKAYIVSGEDVAKTLQIVSRNSLYACEEELRQGFITVAGGHRIGIAGQAVMTEGELKSLKNIGSLNIRLSREVRGAADAVMPYAVSGPRRVMSSLVISPPRCGKTTLLRDMARQLSAGVASLGFAGVQVGIVDERSELAACRDGVPTADLGPRIDVLDGCPKAVGMLMLIRSMAPQVIITDELGREADAAAVLEAGRAGVAVIASAHGKDVADIAARPFVGELIAGRVFDRYIVLGDKPAVGVIQEIAAGGGEVIYRRSGGIKACG